MKILFNLSVLMISISSFSQIENTKILDNNNASAIIGDEGAFFNQSSAGVAGYEIPIGSGLSTIYLGSFWLGAEDINGVFHFSGVKYGTGSMSSQLHSGPISNQNLYTSLSYSNQYLESIWKVSAQEIEDHIDNYMNGGYVAPQSILDWPGNGDVSLGVVAQLAPYIDVNTDGIYDPYDGDYPDIRGDEAVYVIMNDGSSSNPNKLGIELHAMFYQYSAGNYLNNTTFMNVKVFNRSTENYYNYKQTIFLDFDIGNYTDDYVGCNIPNNVGFGYNGDEIDEADGGHPGYGANPPCQGIVSLSHDMHSFGYFTGSGQQPYTDSQASDTVLWNFMNAQWGDSSSWLYGGLGYQGSFGVTNAPTNFLFSGNPNDPSAWHEGSNNNPAGDRRAIFTIAEDKLLSGTSNCSDYAFIYDRSGSRLTNVQNVINIAGSLRNLYNAQAEFPCNSEDLGFIENEMEETFKLFPNPTNGKITIEMLANNTEGKVVISELSGRIILAQSINSQSMEISLNENPGIYMVEIVTNQGSMFQKLIIE